MARLGDPDDREAVDIGPEVIDGRVDAQMIGEAVTDADAEGGGALRLDRIVVEDVVDELDARIDVPAVVIAVRLGLEDVTHVTAQVPATRGDFLHDHRSRRREVGLLLDDVGGFGESAEG